MKKKLFLFGDSFTYGVGCIPEYEYYESYRKEGDDVWFNIVANTLNLEVKNYGMGLYSNDKIIDSIIDAYDFMDEGDYVIIEKGFSHRFDIPNLNNEVLITIAPNCKRLLTSDFTFTSKQYSEWEINSIDYMATVLDSHLINDRHNKRFDFLKKIIEQKNVKKCIIWDITEYMDRSEYPIIFDETNGKVDDYHWTFNSNKKFADNILMKLKDKLI